MMNEQLENLSMALSEAGCNHAAIKKAERLLESGSIEALIRYLRLCRCSLMDDLHKSQKRVDCMDYLIRQAKKFYQTK